MDEDRWSDLAFSLGLSARAGRRRTSATNKFVQRMSKRRHLSSAQTYEIVKPFIESIVSACSKLSQQNRCIYKDDAVPTLESLKNTVHRLPTPTPAISVGYSRDAFSMAQDELQNGIINGPAGEPCDLNHISQPLTGHFWPFFVVEISERSMSAARTASAVSAATCNNALNILAEASIDHRPGWSGSPFLFDHKFIRSFSLSIHGRKVSLGVHGAEGAICHVATQIAMFELDNEDDVAALADRVQGIMVWAHYNRLAEIISTLDKLDRKVHGANVGLYFADDGYDFDPHCLKTLTLQAPRRPNRTKVALRAGLPSWLSR
jgi:hypothetical protein